MPRIRKVARRVSASAAQLLRVEATGGVILLAASIAALVLANSPWSTQYQQLSNALVGPSVLHLRLSVQTWATDGFLAIFFFIAGLELKRELVVGELRDPRRAILPVIAALGGMVAPAVLCAAIAAGAPGGGRAWPVPVATDIAFALAVLAIAAPGLPASLRAFLLSLAVVDDLGAITLIAAVFTTGINWLAMGVAALLLGAYAWLQHARVRSPLIYIPLVVASWVAIHSAGIHATIAGVALGLLTRVKHDRGEPHSPATRLEHRLAPWSAGLCVPLFGFFAVGLPINATVLRAFVNDRVVWAVVIGLVIGKLIGVFGGAFLAVRTGLARLPAGASWLDIAALAAVAGCGFTVSLLITELAYGLAPQSERIKLAVLFASMAAGLIATVMLRSRLKAHRGP